MAKLVDPTTMTIEQLHELMTQKATIEKLQSLLDQTKNTAATVKKVCSFKPTRVNQEVCTDVPVVFYGEKGYCGRHRRSVQAINAKKNEDELKDVQPPLVVSSKVEEKSEEIIVPDTKSRDSIPVVKAEVQHTKGVESTKPKVTTEVKSATPTTKKSQSVDKVESGKSPKPVEKPQPKITKKKITANAWGRFEDTDTGIVFDPSTKSAYGVQDHITGKVNTLTLKHIEICKRHQWKYHTVPNTLKIERCDDCKLPLERCECVEEDVDEEENESGDGVVNESDEDVDGEVDEENDNAESTNSDEVDGDEENVTDVDEDVGSQSDDE